MKTKFEIYQDREQQYRWRAKRSGRIVADSGEGYTRRNRCRTSMENFIRSIGLGRFTVTT